MNSALCSAEVTEGRIAAFDLDSVRAPRPAEPGRSVCAKQISLDQLYRRHRTEICDFIARTFGAGPPDPEDAAHAAFARYAAFERKDSIENPRAFLFRSARNFVLDFHRRQLTQRRYASEASDCFAESPARLDQHRVLEGKQRLVAVLAAVATLEPRRRSVLIWRTLHESTFSDIAAHMGISQARVRQLLADAIQQCEAAADSREADANHRCRS